MDTTFNKDAWAQKKQAQRKALFDTIEGFLDGLALDERKFRSLLTVMGRFPRRSLNNLILLADGFPDAKDLRTYKEWNEAGISIQKGQHGTALLVPSGTYTKPDGKTGTNFEVQSFFDISQTNATIPEPQLDMKQLLMALLLRPACPVTVLERTGGAVYLPKERRIEIGKGLSQEETFQTLALTLAHAKLHGEQEEYSPSEPKNSFDARCVSFAICTHYGISTDSLHLQDVSQYATLNNAELKEQLASLRSTVHGMISELEQFRNDLASYHQRETGQEER